VHHGIYVGGKSVTQDTTSSSYCSIR